LEFAEKYKFKDNIIAFDTSQYLDKVAKSFNYDSNEIDRQFDVDFDRSLLCYNNNQIYKKEVLFDELNNYNMHNIQLNNGHFPLNKIILMLCNQSSLAFSFFLMCKMYNNVNDGIFVTSNKSTYNITKNDVGFNIELIVAFNLKNINKNAKISEINIITNLDIILINKKYEFCKLGLIYWNIRHI
jgi:hypothetical protein